MFHFSRGRLTQSAVPMDSTAQYSVLHDDFLKASESGKVAKDPATMYHPTTAGKQGVTTAVLIKNAVFRTMSEVLVPTAPSKSMWMLQFLIVWAQVRACCDVSSQDFENTLGFWLPI